MERLKQYNKREHKRRRPGDVASGEENFDYEDLKRAKEEAQNRGVRSPKEDEYLEFPPELRAIIAFFDSLYSAEILGVVQPVYRGDRDDNEP